MGKPDSPLSVVVDRATGIPIPADSFVFRDKYNNTSPGVTLKYSFTEEVMVYGKMTRAKDNAILVAVNLDPDNGQQAHFEVPLWEFGLPDHASIQVEDLLSGHRFTWNGKVQQIWLDPEHQPCALWRLIPPGATSSV